MSIGHGFAPDEPIDEVQELAANQLCALLDKVFKNIAENKEHAERMAPKGRQYK